MTPVHVLDVAEALSVMLTAPVTSTSSTFALTGPETYTFQELVRLVEFFIMKKFPNFPTIPKPAIMAIAKILNKSLWWPTINPDEMTRKYIDDAGVAHSLYSPDSSKPQGWNLDDAPKAITGVDGEPVKGFADLNITPDLIEDHAQKYLRRYREECVSFSADPFI